VRILASGDLDEYKITSLLEQGAPIDSFGVGTAFAGGALGAVYKVSWLQEEVADGEGKIKLAGEKTTWPGRKEVYRIGAFTEDIIQLESEAPPANAARLLRPVMRNGMALPGSEPPISEIWELAQQNISRLPEKYKSLSNPDTYPVRFSPELQELRQRTSAHYIDDGVVQRLK
jgi:nicotinate phosphoribosyltransferase